MRIQRYMVAIKASFCVVLLVLLLVAATVSSIETKEGTQEDFVRKLLDPVSELLDEDTEKVLWTTCWENLIHLKKEIEDRDLCLREELSITSDSIGSEVRPLEQADIQNLINICRSWFEENFVRCSRKSYFPLLVSGEEDDSKIWHVAYMESHISRSSAPTRNSGRVLLQQISGPPSPGPAVGSPTPSLSPSPGPSLAPTPGPSLAPTPGPSLSPSSAPAPVVPRPLHPPLSPSSFFPQLTPPASADISAPPSSDNNKPADKRSNKKTVVLAVVLTASLTFIGAVLLFLFCSKARRARRNDERPLLSLSMNDYSVGPSSYVFGNSVNGEKLGFQSSGNNLVGNKKTSVQESQSIGAHSAAAGSSFELSAPSQWVGTIPSGMPPLKPPPGRMNPLPPEPPSFRASGNAASVPPPAPHGPQQSGVAGAPPPGPSRPLAHPASGGTKHAPPPPQPPPAPAGTKPSPPPPPPLAPAGAKPGPPPPPPPAPAGAKPGPRPPPPPKSGIAPPRPPPPLGARPLASRQKATENVEAGAGEADAPKAKLKPFFWDKVQANSDQSMVWNQIKSGSFQFNEEMIETLFGAVDKNNGQRMNESSPQYPSPLYIQIVDKRKAQNLLILLRALNVTMEEVCDALYEGSELPPEFLQTLLKMAPTADEELKLRLFSGELSQLGPADRFLKALVDIPFAFKRMEALLFISTLKEELNSTMESFATLEVACKELRNSRLFLKLLEAVLKTGNRMNDGTFRGGAQAFKLDTLLKLSDVKGTDGKTTLLHFVVQEIIRSEGIKAARLAKESQTDDLLKDSSDETEDHYREIGLQVVSRLSSGLENVKRAAVLDADSLTGTTAKLGRGLIKTKDLVNKDLKNVEEEDRGFLEAVKSFVQNSEADVVKLLEEEKKVTALVKSTGDYFHGNTGKDEGLRLFVIVRDFLIMLDKACKEVRDAQKKPTKTQKQEASKGSASSETRSPPLSDYRQRLFPAIAERRVGDDSSDDESP